MPPVVWAAPDCGVRMATRHQVAMKGSNEPHMAAHGHAGEVFVAFLKPDQTSLGAPTAVITRASALRPAGGAERVTQGRRGSSNPRHDCRRKLRSGTSIRCPSCVLPRSSYAIPMSEGRSVGLRGAVMRLPSERISPRNELPDSPEWVTSKRSGQGKGRLAHPNKQTTPPRNAQSGFPVGRNG